MDYPRNAVVINWWLEGGKRATWFNNWTVANLALDVVIHLVNDMYKLRNYLV